jgi:hypothetical protein
MESVAEEMVKDLEEKENSWYYLQDEGDYPE